MGGSGEEEWEGGGGGGGLEGVLLKWNVQCHKGGTVLDLDEQEYDIIYVSSLIRSVQEYKTSNKFGNYQGVFIESFLLFYSVVMTVVT